MGSALRVHVLGPSWSFSHEVALKLFEKAEISLNRTISEVFRSVASDEQGVGVVPIENSLQGPVNETVDGLAEYEQIFVKEEGVMKVNLVLAKNPKSEKLTHIASNPYALSQASSFIAKNKFEVISVPSTSQAAEVAARESEVGAICSELAARHYGLEIVARHVEDRESYTRFFVLAHSDSPIGAKKSTLIMNLEHKPGALFRALEAFAKNDVNLLMIYSRPLRSSRWEYYFYLDFEGSRIEHKVNKALEELTRVTQRVLVKGSYSSKNINELFKT
jgi:prephenate dehydratase